MIRDFIVLREPLLSCTRNWNCISNSGVARIWCEGAAQNYVKVICRIQKWHKIIIIILTRFNSCSRDWKSSWCRRIQIYEPQSRFAVYAGNRSMHCGHFTAKLHRRTRKIWVITKLRNCGDFQTTLETARRLKHAGFSGKFKSHTG